jgi:hypothetical protein
LEITKLHPNIDNTVIFHLQSSHINTLPNKTNKVYLN